MLEPLEVRQVLAGDFLWAAGIGGGASGSGQATTVDLAGNVYAVGSFQGTADFDPGAGVTELTGAGGNDIYVAKYSTTGALAWAKRMGGSLDDQSYGVAVDAAGNVVVTGLFRGTADFDPGAGTVNLTSAGGYDIFVAKLDAAGNYVWAERFGDTSDDAGSAVAVDTTGNVVVTGYFAGTVDFDPGAGAAGLTSAGNNDIYVAKYSAADGALMWANRYGDTNSDSGFAVAVNAAGNIVVTGAFRGTVDFDPGAGTADLTSASLNGGVFVAKYDAAGNYVWADAFGGTSGALGSGVAMDAAGNVVVTGSFQGAADFDPGAGTVNLTSAGFDDVFVAKLDAAGNYLWADRFGGTNNDSGFGSALDSAGNVVVTGWFAGTVDFDPGAGTANLTSAGDEDAFVAKLDAAGNYLWANRLGSDDRDYGFSAAADAAGNVIVTGRFQHIADFDPGAGTFNLNAGAGQGAFVWQLGSTGALNWAVAPFRASPGTARATVVDSAGNVYVVGDFAGTVDFDPGPGVTELTSAADYDAYVVKYSAAGALLWVAQFGSIDFSDAYGVTLDSVGNVIVAGMFQGTVDFDPGAGTANLTSAGDQDAFALKLDSSGNYLWAKQFGGTEQDLGLAATVDASNNVVLTGSFRATVDFDPGAGTATLTSPGTSDDVFVVKLDSAGNYLWAKQLGGTDYDWGQSVNSDAAGNVVVTGSFRGTADFDPGAGVVNLTSAGEDDAFVAKLDAAGNYLWAKQFGGTQRDSGESVATDAAGNVVVTGSFYGTVDFDPDAGTANLTSAGASDAFVVKLNAAGNYLWAKRLGSTSFDGGAGVAVNNAGEIFLTGGFQGTVDFNPGTGTANLTSAGLSDAYTAKLSSSGSFLWAKHLGGADYDGGGAIATNGLGDVVVAGSFRRTADFDPGPGTHNLNAGSSNAGFVVKLIDRANTAPVFALSDGGAVPVVIDRGRAALAIDENTPTSATQNGLLVGTINVTDAEEPGAALTVTMTDRLGAFAFDNATGRITVADASKLNYERRRSATLTFKVTDHGLSGSTLVKTTTLRVTVSLNNLNETSAITSANTFAIAENNRANATMGTVRAVDPDRTSPNRTLTYSIISQKDEANNPVALFTIDPARGTIRVPTASVLNFEAHPFYTLVVRATDGGTPALHFDQTITVNVLDLNEAPLLSLLDAALNPIAEFTVPENSPNGTLLGYVQVVNPDVTRGETLTLTGTSSLSGALALGALDINGRAAVTVANVAKLDFEAIRNGFFTLTVRAVDSGFVNNAGARQSRRSSTARFTIRVTDVVE